jgi:hypothetical protein
MENPPQPTRTNSSLSASSLQDALSMARQMRESIRQSKESVRALRSESREAMREAKAIRIEMGLIFDQGDHLSVDEISETSTGSDLSLYGDLDSIHA